MCQLSSTNKGMVTHPSDTSALRIVLIQSSISQISKVCTWW